jgi:hypothetical protein
MASCPTRWRRRRDTATDASSGPLPTSFGGSRAVNTSIDFLHTYGSMLVFTCVLLEQAGVPIPCTPWLIAAGALARLGQGTVALPIALATLAASLGHSVWFFAGRHWGSRVLRLVCRVSLEPDICVQRTENVFTRYGARALVIAPFIPGSPPWRRRSPGCPGCACGATSRWTRWATCSGRRASWAWAGSRASRSSGWWEWQRTTRGRRRASSRRLSRSIWPTSSSSGCVSGPSSGWRDSPRSS